jgi:hypothetical protein
MGGGAYRNLTDDLRINEVIQWVTAGSGWRWIPWLAWWLVMTSSDCIVPFGDTAETPATAKTAPTASQEARHLNLRRDPEWTGTTPLCPPTGEARTDRTHFLEPASSRRVALSAAPCRHMDRTGCPAQQGGRGAEEIACGPTDKRSPLCTKFSAENDLQRQLATFGSL